MSAPITVSSTGLVYRNPHPHVRSLVAYHPSLISGSKNEWLATFDIGQAVESLDYRTVVSRSRDDGQGWNIEGPLLKQPPPATSHTVRTSRLGDNSIVGFGALFHREHCDQGLINRETFGFVPLDLFLVRSHDDGLTWTAPARIDPPLRGPSWEMCHPIVELRSGRWLAPTATWRGWNGENPSGEQTVAFISDDQGKNWPRYGRIFDGRETQRCHLEVSLLELLDGRVLAVSWPYDVRTGTTFPTEYCFSEDQGETFGQSMRAGIEAQTCKVLQLADGRILFVYRRNDQPGLWAALAEVHGTKMEFASHEPLWQGAESGMTGKESSAHKLSMLKFGYPSPQQMDGGDVLILFWCQEDCLTAIRWLRLALS
jgi:sialidase-1